MHAMALCIGDTDMLFSGSDSYSCYRFLSDSESARICRMFDRHSNIPGASVGTSIDSAQRLNVGKIQLRQQHCGAFLQEPLSGVPVAYCNMTEFVYVPSAVGIYPECTTSTLNHSEAKFWNKPCCVLFRLII